MSNYGTTEMGKMNFEIKQVPSTEDILQRYRALDDHHELGLLKIAHGMQRMDKNTEDDGGEIFATMIREALGEWPIVPVVDEPQLIFVLGPSVEENTEIVHHLAKQIPSRTVDDYHEDFLSDQAIHLALSGRENIILSFSKGYQAKILDIARRFQPEGYIIRLILTNQVDLSNQGSLPAVTKTVVDFRSKEGIQASPNEGSWMEVVDSLREDPVFETVVDYPVLTAD